MRIVSLVDFSNTTLNALDHAIDLAVKSRGEIILLHVASKYGEEEKKNIEKGMVPYIEKCDQNSINYTIQIDEGNFYDKIDMILAKLMADLLVVGTHGKTGWKQSLLGSNILKLVKRISVPSLIIQENTTVPEGGYSHILFPFGEQTDVDLKFGQTKKVLHANSKIHVYHLDRTGEELSKSGRKKLEKLQEKFQESNINHEISKEEITTYSVGNAKQTIEFAIAQKCDLISIMADVPDKNSYYGYADKENVILNPHGIPTLCVI